MGRGGGSGGGERIQTGWVPASVTTIMEFAVRATVLVLAVREIDKKYRMEHVAEVGFRCLKFCHCGN